MINVYIDLDQGKYPSFLLEKIKNDISTLVLPKYLGRKQTDVMNVFIQRDAKHYMQNKGLQLVASYDSLISFLEKLSVRVR